MESQHRRIKIEHFQNIVAIAHADGLLDEQEIIFLSKKADEFNIPAHQVGQILKHPEDLRFEAPMDDEQREELLTDAVYLSMVNGDINEREYKLCLEIGHKLGYNDKDLSRIIALVKKLWN